MTNILRLTAVGVALAGLFAIAPRTTEAVSTSMTYLTFSGAVALPGVTLAAGTYIFDLPAGDPSVVRVSSRDGSRVFFTAFTHIVNRPRGITSDQHVTLGEAAYGEPKPIQVWHVSTQGTSWGGREFIYPK
jgi:hypothetical protein